jgi:peptidyl-tRNA hydrolase, PTH1 family
MSDAISLIVGLGNPGQQYQQSRHNAGALFLTHLCETAKVELRPNSKLFGHSGSIKVAGQEIRLLFPTTYMNNSGQAVAAIVQYYKISPAQILIAHDDLDLPVGTTRLKMGGGHGGHNGIRDVIKALETADFLRLRLGIARPGESSQVLDHVLGEFSRQDALVLADEFIKASAILPMLVAGKVQIAMNQLHTKN